MAERTGNTDHELRDKDNKVAERAGEPHGTGEKVRYSTKIMVAEGAMSISTHQRVVLPFEIRTSLPPFAR